MSLGLVFLNAGSLPPAKEIAKHTSPISSSISSQLPNPVMIARFNSLGLSFLKNKFVGLAQPYQDKFVANFLGTTDEVLRALGTSNKTTFENWKNWAQNGEGTKLPGAPTITPKFSRYFYDTNDLSRIDHSDIGEFKRPSNPHVTLEPGIMHSGGHGQRNLDYLTALGWTYRIEHTYPNGVRIGNIQNHTDGAKKAVGGRAQSWFPTTWLARPDPARPTLPSIEAAKNYVLSNNRAEFSALPTSGRIFDYYQGVKVIILKTTGEGYADDIGSVFPDCIQ